jgi:dCTP diphosphatase
MSKDDGDTTIQELKDLVARFRDERNWRVHHSPKNLAMSIAIEAAELMEHFQWDDYGEDDKKAVADELADILVYCMNFADTLGIDVASSFRSKLKDAEIKYPVETFNASHDDPADYVRIKKAYRQKKGKP